jgi:uncharacterized membrane protein YhaH (DUF805 family)
MFALLYLIVTIVLFVPFLVDFFSAFSDSGRPSASSGEPFDAIGTLSWVALGLWALFALIAFIPGLALSVRRFHDVGMSGWIYVALYVGSIIFGIVGLAIIVIALLPSQESSNKWGPNPKDPFDSDVFA